MTAAIEGWREERLESLVRRATEPGMINFGGGLPSDLQFPKRALAAAFVRVLATGDSSALQYGWAEGQAGLRERIAARLNARGAHVAAEDVIITNGAQQAISIAVDLLLRPGDAVGVEDVSYPAALAMFRRRGLRLAPLGRGRACYVMPSLNNPAGAMMTESQRRQLCARRIPIIEDDAYGDLVFSSPPGPPLLADVPARTYHVGTFSKTLCPGLRVGWLIAPVKQRRRALHIKESADLQANSLAQAVVADFLAHDDFEARVALLRRFYRARAVRLATEVRRFLPSWRFEFPTGGFSLWLTTDAPADELAFLETALQAGVAFDVGSTFEGAPQPTTCAHWRLCYSFTAPSTFARGVERLAKAWRRIARRTRVEK